MSVRTPHGPFLGRTLEQLGTDLRSGRTTAVQLADEACTAAEKTHDLLNCFITIDRAGSHAAAIKSDYELTNGYDRGPLHGIPIAIKDVIATGGLRTTMASQHFAEHEPLQDADVVASLRAAGGIIMGKTNCHEFSYGIRGDVGAFGAAVNPYDPEKITGGSSSGSAVAVAAGIVPIALGTDTAGSVRVPAALCGVVGFKPTTGSLSASGIFPLAPSFDTAGILCGSIADTELVWNAVALQGATHFQAARTGPAVAEEIGVTVGALSDAAAMAGSVEVLDAFSRAVASLEAVGQEIRLVSLNSEYDFAKIYNVIRAAEAYVVHQELLAEAPEAYQPETLERIRAGETLTYSQVANSREEMQRVRSVFLDRFRNFDIFITPTVPILAPDAADNEPSIGPALLSLTVIWNVLGWPAVTIPVHVAGCNLPQSVQLIAKPGMEGILLMMAKKLEKCLAKNA